MKNNMNVEKALERAREPKSIHCGACQEELFSPIDKLSIHLYGVCPIHLVDGGHKETNLLKISESI